MQTKHSASHFTEKTTVHILKIKNKDITLRKKWPRMWNGLLRHHRDEIYPSIFLIIKFISTLIWPLHGYSKIVGYTILCFIMWLKIYIKKHAGAYVYASLLPSLYKHFSPAILSWQWELSKLISFEDAKPKSCFSFPVKYKELRLRLKIIFAQFFQWHIL